MERKNVPHRRAPGDLLSRRGLLTSAATAAMAALRPPAPVQAQERGTILAYVGTYTDRGSGIHTYVVNPSDGSLSKLKVYTGIPSPSSLAFDPSNRYLYAVNEISNFAGTTTGSVTAFAVDRTNGDLTKLNVVSSQGGGPAHLSVDSSGKYVLAANYGGGSVALLPIQSNGALGSATDVQAITGPLGPTRAYDAPPGSFAISGHDRPHAHMAETDPTGRFVLVSDLATDRIYIYKFDTTTGKLSPNDQAFVQATPGAGPRHFAFHPNGLWLYSINEEASTVDFMAYDRSRGSLEPQQTLSTLPFEYEGTNFTSEIGVSPDGNYVYALNRLHDSVAMFSIDGGGGLDRLGEVWTGGSYPRHFGIDPTGNFMYVLNQRSDHIATFRIDRTTGLLKHTGQYTGVGNPSKIVFFTVPG